jgi:acyl transferase domain-containing protein
MDSTVELKESGASDDSSSSDIAIIGLAGRFPGAGDVEEFWQNLERGVESIQFFSDEELKVRRGVLRIQSEGR